MNKNESIIADRKRTDRYFEPIAKRLPPNPNSLSVISFILAMIYSFITWFSGINNFSPGLFFAFFFLLFSSALDAVDGTVARLRKLESKWGDYLDHALDRIADTSFIIAIIFGGYVRWEIGLFSFAGIFLTSDFGALAKAAGLPREYGGIMGRTIRLVVLMAATISNAICPDKIGMNGVGFTFLGWAMVIFAIGGIYTAYQRFHRTRNALIKSESR